MPTGFPTRPVPRLDTTGLVAGRSEFVFIDMDFSDKQKREQGATHLWTPPAASNCGATYWIDRGGSGRVATRANYQLAGQAMGLIRDTSYFGSGRYQVEGTHSVEYLNADQSQVMAFTMGVDTCTDAGVRRFFNPTFRNYNETSATLERQWLLDMGVGYTGGTTLVGNPGGRFVAMPGASAFEWPANENKALPFKVELDIDIDSGRYLGFKFGNLYRAGTYADTNRDALWNLGPIMQETLTPYLSGFNYCQSVYNRSTGTKTKGQINCHKLRATFLGKFGGF